MNSLKGIRTLKNPTLKNKRILVRVDFDVPTDENGTIIDDTRIAANIPTLKHLTQHGNRLILIGKRGRPKGQDTRLSMKPIVDVLPDYMPGSTFKLISDFLEEKVETFVMQDSSEILVLENIRFYDEKTRKGNEFLAALCALADVYVNDSFAMSHRDEATITGLPQHMPGYMGFQLETEVHNILHAIQKPRRPVVSIIGGAKIATKVNPIKKLLTLSDHILIGGGIANTFLKAHGYEIGKSLYEESEVHHAQDIIQHAAALPVNIVLPVDARVGSLKKTSTSHVVTLPTLPDNGHILDIGPATEHIFADIIAQAGTIIWNGPMGVFEREEFKHGTDEVYRAVIHNHESFSLVGGGDTLAALARKKQKHGINHISTGGGAMLYLIQHGDMPGLKALRESTAKLD